MPDLDRHFRIRWWIAACLLSASLAHADIQLPALFSDHMVLQAGRACFIWGRANPGERITVSFARGDTVERLGEMESDTEGNWSGSLSGLKAGKEGTLIVDGGESPAVEIRDVLVGEVWLCSGQSNMQWPVAQAGGVERALERADRPTLRYFHVPFRGADEPRTDLDGIWKVSTPGDARWFSAVAFAYGVELQGALKRPVGLIHASWGATKVEAWTPPEVFKQQEETLPLWETFSQAADSGSVSSETRDVPGVLYNGMIHGLVGYTLAGVIWYQGEHNARNPEQYKILFPLLIESWRNLWNQGDFPFLHVELAAYGPPQKQPSEEGWASIREAQKSALALPNTGMITAIDVGSETNIHPPDKWTVGHRLADAALALAYDREGLRQSPMLTSWKTRGSEIVLSFSNASGGLATNDGAPPRPFAIRGENGEWRWADTRIEGSDIVAWNGEIRKPAAVRYAWAGNPDVNVYNRAGLPLIPFKTDEDK